ncbi:MAG: hypothetical protein QFC55_06175 [Chloroflexota bacterium]|nr:hypothetical protein [Chloroflexota bacterium]
MIAADDLVLIGPGSEWFWVMAQFIALAVTGLAIFRQLRTQRSASVYEQETEMWQEFESPTMIRSKLALMLALKGRDPSAGLPVDTDEVADFFQRIGYLSAQGHFDPETLWSDGSWQVVEFYWGLLEPYIKADRAGSSDPTFYRWFEWLDAQMRRLGTKHGEAHPPFDASQRERQLDARIDIFRAKLRRFDPGWGVES